MLSLLLAGDLLLAAHALRLVLGHRVPLSVLVGGAFPALAAALGLAVLACVLALAARLRASRRAARVGTGAPADSGTGAHSEPPPGWWPVRAAAYVLLLAGLVFVLALQPYRTILVQAALGVAAGAHAALVLAARPLAAAVPRRARTALDVALLGLCVFAVGGELGLRAWAARHPSPLFARRDASAAALIDTWRLRPANASPGFPVNATGHRDADFRPKAPGVPLAVVIGDSFSASTVPHQYHFTTLAEEALGLGPVVANMGVAGVGPREYLELLRTEALPLLPDVVVVDLFIGNDIIAQHGEVAADGPLRDWLDRDRLLLACLPRALVAATRADAARGDAARADAERTDAERARDARDEAPVRLAPDTLARLQPWIEDPLREVSTMPEDLFLRLEAESALDLCGPRPAAWPAVFALLDEMQRACGRTPFLVMLIPDAFQVEDAIWAHAVAGAGGEPLERDRPQRILGEWLAARGIPCLDLLPVLRAVPPLADGSRHLYTACDYHFNVRGHEATAPALAALLRPYLGGAASEPAPAPSPEAPPR